jgi:N-acetylglucosaminyldiphosphoundecaprenol N-acetyl-beta-D-mannosaminyltransferase
LERVGLREEKFVPKRFVLRRRSRAKGSREPGAQLRLFGLKIQNVSVHEAANTLVAAARARLRRRVYFVNAHCVNVAVRDAEYSRALESADLIFADGSGMAIAARMAGTPLRANVNGTDLFPILCQQAAALGVPMALLGAKPGIAERCAKNMKRRYPGLEFAWIHHGYFREEETPALLASLNKSGAGILLVAKGVPLQELWITRMASQIEVPVVLGVGALFDFYSGSIPRSPAWMRRLGMEWAFRLALEPRRLFTRYVVGNPMFLSRLLARRLRGGYMLRKRRLAP